MGDGMGCGLVKTYSILNHFSTLDTPLKLNFRFHMIFLPRPREHLPSIIPLIQKLILSLTLGSIFPSPSPPSPIHSPIEFRISSPDGIPLSPSSRKATLWIGIILYRPYSQDPEPMGKIQYWEGFEGIMKKFGGRPHWAKGFEGLRRLDLEAMYGESIWNEFDQIRGECDGEGILVNPWARRHVIKSVTNQPKL